MAGAQALGGTYVRGDRSSRPSPSKGSAESARLPCAYVPGPGERSTPTRVYVSPEMPGVPVPP